MSSDTGFDVVDPIEGEDLSGVDGNQVIEPASKVRFTLKDVKVNKVESKDDKEHLFTRLEPTFVVGPLGVDGNGKYKGKHFFGNRNLKFPGLLLARNKERYNTPWWKEKAAYGYKQFLTALGLPTNPSPRVDDKFLQDLKGKEIIADIKREAIEEKDENGKYYKTDEMENYLTNFRKVD